MNPPLSVMAGSIAEPCRGKATTLLALPLSRASVSLTAVISTRGNHIVADGTDLLHHDHVRALRHWRAGENSDGLPFPDNSVMFLALKLWSHPVSGPARQVVTFRHVFVTTVLNPKGLIIGLVLLPAVPSVSFAGAIALFCLVSGVASVWILAGRVFHHDGVTNGGPILLQRAAACWLAVLPLGLIAGTLPGWASGGELPPFLGVTSNVIDCSV